MTPGILMLIGFLALITGLFGVVWNFYKIAKTPLDKLRDSFIQNGFKRISLHLAFGVLYCGGALALLGGFIWFLVTVAKA